MQTQTDGPVSLIVVDFIAPDRLRAYARHDASRIAPGMDFGGAAGAWSSRHDHRSGSRI
ncbi:hypothetical protein [Streptomyces griseus]